MCLLVIGHPHESIADALADNEIQLIPSIPSGQPSGTVIMWTVAMPGQGPFDYRLMVGLSGEPPQVMYDFFFYFEFEFGFGSGLGRPGFLNRWKSRRPGPHRTAHRAEVFVLV